MSRRIPILASVHFDITGRHPAVGLHDFEFSLPLVGRGGQGRLAISLGWLRADDAGAVEELSRVSDAFHHAAGLGDHMPASSRPVACPVLDMGARFGIGFDFMASDACMFTEEIASGDPVAEVCSLRLVDGDLGNAELLGSAFARHCHGALADAARAAGSAIELHPQGPRPLGWLLFDWSSATYTWIAMMAQAAALCEAGEIAPHAGAIAPAPARADSL